MAVTANLITQQSPKYSVTDKGGERQLVYLVDGLNPTQDPLVQAASAAGVPRYGNAYPFLGGAGMFCTRIDFMPFRDARDKVYAVATFASPQIQPNSNTVKISITSSSQQQKTNMDDKGKPISCTWTPPGRLNALPSQPIEITIFCCRTVLEYVRVEGGSPLTKSRQYTRSVNKAAWNGGDPLTWLCRSITANQLGNNLWEVHYNFEYEERTWVEDYVFIDSNGHPPGAQFIKRSPNNDNGIYSYTPPQRDFNGLGLPNAF